MNCLKARPIPEGVVRLFERQIQSLADTALILEMEGSFVDPLAASEVEVKKTEDAPVNTKRLSYISNKSNTAIVEGSMSQVLDDILRHCSSFDVTDLPFTTAIQVDISTHKHPSEKIETFFYNLFIHEFIINDATKNSQDDLLYFVRNKDPSNPESAKVEEENFYVKRRDQVKESPPTLDSLINWQETCFLNLLLHFFNYTIEVSIRIKEEPQSSTSSPKKTPKTKTIKSVVTKVYPTPNKTRMDKKADEVELTYPLLYFAIDDFNEIWKDIILSKDGELVCVELYAEGNYFTQSKQMSGKRFRLFGGGLDYHVVKNEYKQKSSMWKGPTTHFFKLLGPKGKGAAEMAVKAQTEPPKSPEQTRSWGGINKLGSAFKKMPYFTTAEDPVLGCSLTTLCMKWDLIMKDVLSFASKYYQKQNETHV